MMDLVIDANVVFSATIRDGLTRKLLLSGLLRLYAPEFLLGEVTKYAGLLAKKSGNSQKEVESVLADLFENAGISVFATPEVRPFKPSAERVCPDKDDVEYFALALKLGCPIWSNDKKLKEQSKVKVYSTKEVAGLISKM
jgi:predicted nucleic acid-binding protein